MCIYTHIYKVCVHIYIHNVAVSEHRELCGVVSHMTVLLASVGKEEERRLLPFNGHISLGCFFLLFLSPLSCPNLIQARRCALLPYLGPKTCHCLTTFQFPRRTICKVLQTFTCLLIVCDANCMQSYVVFLSFFFFPSPPSPFREAAP